MENDSNHKQTIIKNGPPVLSVEPGALDFGEYNANIPLLQQPYIHVRIRNTGGGLLTGRIIPQVSWLIANPITFKCEAGEISDHYLQLSTGAPQNWNSKEHRFKHVLIISSNAGAASLDAAYDLNEERKTPTRQTMRLEPKAQLVLQTKVLVPAAVIIFGIFMFLGAYNLIRSGTADDVDMRREVMTQSAQTMEAEVASAEKTFTAQNAALAYELAPTPTSLSLFNPAETATPDLTATALSPTYTPWVFEDFPNPEQFIYDYIALLQAKDFRASWELMSLNYQETYSQLGADSYVFFMSEWEEVESVEVISAYLQSWDLNPAPVLVRLKVKKIDQDPVELTQMYYLITNTAGDNLLIDSMEELSSLE
ncbi:MAG: hypothetical protein JW750_00325 [Anaerolineaceae bacterium]|nr:hypothetical protein [Anaerolineaceae bacterium]